MNIFRKFLEDRKYKNVKFRVVNIDTRFYSYANYSEIQYEVEVVKEGEETITFRAVTDYKYKNNLLYTRKVFLNEYKKELRERKAENERIRKGDIL